MITLTDAASSHLATLLEESDVPEENAVRLVMGAEGLALATDEPGPEDTKFEHNGKTVLVLDAQVTEALGDRTLDVEDTENGKALSIS
jgi:Fe-S cluster assembly iron-binding protein IscA